MVRNLIFVEDERHSLTVVSVLAKINKSESWRCVLLTLYNLAAPRWIKAHCAKPLVDDILCFQENNENTSIQKYPSMTFCGLWEVAATVKNIPLCWSFSWHTQKSLQQRRSCSQTESLQAIRQLQFIFDVVSEFSLQFFVKQCRQVVRCKKVLNTLYCKRQHVTSKVNGIIVFNHLPKQFKISGNLKRCNKDVFMTLLGVCYRKITWSNEAVYRSNYSVEGMQRKLSHQRQCSPLFFSGHASDCKMHLAEMLVQEEISPMNAKFQKQEQTTCGAASCQANDQVFCSNSDNLSYNISQICTFQMDNYGHVFPCQRGEHLQSCRKFECNAMFKCPGFYCIPWSYVCDTKWDCPAGSDEEQHHSCGPQRLCKNLFKCQAIHKCVHLVKVCNGLCDCKPTVCDDETLCSLWNKQCPPSCTCLALAVYCEGGNITGVSHSFPHVAIFLHKCNLVAGNLHSLLVAERRNVVTLTVQHCNMTNVCNLMENSNHQYSIFLLNIQFASNSISHLGRNCFSGNTKLKSIALDKNLLTNVDHGAFKDMFYLKVLDLSHNNLTTFSSLSFVPEISLVFLSLQGNKIHALCDMFSALSLTLLQTDSFKACCVKPEGTYCTQPLPWYMSCGSLLPSLIFKLIFSLVPFVIVFMNLMSIVLQKLSLRQTRDQSGFTPTVMVINQVDITCSVPLVSLWIVDLVHEQNFVLKEHEWRSNVGCFINFIIALNFAVLSPLLLSFLSISRMLIVCCPLTTVIKRRECVLKVLRTMTVFTFILVVTFVSFSVTSSFSMVSPSVLCSPFVDPTRSHTVIFAVTWITAFLQTSAAVLVTVMHIAITETLKRNTNSLKHVVSKKLAFFGVVIQLGIISVSTVLCWVPSAIVFVMSLYLEAYPTEMMLLMMAVVVPLNPVTYSCVFSVTELKRLLS